MNQEPVLAIDGADPKYEGDHLKHFFGTKVHGSIMALSQEDKERWFTIHRDFEDIIDKVYGEKMFNYMVGAHLAESCKRGINDPLVNEYREWLNK